MPYEKSIFDNLFEIKNYNIPIMNTSYFDNENKKCSSYQKQLDDENSQLFDYCYTYIVIINVILMIFFIYDLFKTYCIYNLPKSPKSPKYNSKSSLVSFNSFTIDYKKNDDQEDNFELVDIEKIDSDIAKIDKTDKSEKQIRSYFIIYYWNNSGFLYELIKTFEFIILIGIFEYCFFKFIVNEFKIANKKTIMCNIIKKLQN